MTTTTKRTAITKRTASRSSAGFGAALQGGVATFMARPLVWVLVAVWLLQVVIFAYAINAAVYSQNPGSPTGTLLAGSLGVNVAHVWPLASMPTYGSFVFVLLGALAGASDYRFGTFRLILPRYASRTGLLGARIVCLAVLSVVVSALTLLTSFAASAIVSSSLKLDTGVPPVSDVLVSLALGALVVFVMTAIGFALSLALRSLLGGFLAGFGWAIGIEVLLMRMLSPLAGWVDGVRGLLPVGSSSTLIAAVGEKAGLDTAATAGLSELVSPWAAAAALIAWTVILFATAIALFRRRDV